MKHTIPAVIFTGGKSSRMKQDKALLPFGGSSSLAAYQYNRLGALFETVYLSAKTDKFDFCAPLLPDLYPEYSPMVGLVSVLRQIEAQRCFILSVDAPFVTTKIIDTLLCTEGSYDAVVARNQGKVQPLCGVYAKSMLPAAAQTLEEGGHKMGRLLQEAHTCFIDFEEEEAFLNLNHPHEYEKALLLTQV
jgi:molybdopterin-guanine dinucleotide biosynthesis protein A